MKAHQSQPEDGRGRNTSGHEKKVTYEEHSQVTSRDQRGRDLLGCRRKGTDREEEKGEETVFWQMEMWVENEKDEVGNFSHNHKSVNKHD